MYRVRGNGYFMVLAAVALLAGSRVHGASAQDATVTQRYDSAARFASWNEGALLQNADVQPHWSAAGDAFWYTLYRGDVSEFIVRRAVDGAILKLIDGKAFLESLAAQTHLDASWPAFQAAGPVLFDAGRQILLNSDGRRWRCDLLNATCAAVIDEHAAKPGDAVSPDGRLAAFVREFNLWVRDLRSGAERQITTDGAAHRAYASASEEALGILTGRTLLPDIAAAVIWSPDSRHLVTVRVDETAVPEFAVVDQVPRDQLLPRVQTIRYNFLTQGSLVRQELYVVDALEGSTRAIGVDEQPIGFDSTIFMRRAWWSPGGHDLAIAIFDPAERWVDLYRVDPSTGTARKVFREESRYRVYIASELQYPPPVALLSNGDLIWYSIRDGFGHLFRIDGATGRVKHTLTKGSWTVHRLLYVDEHSGWVYFEAGGDTYGPEPYFASVYRSRLDGSRVERLTREPADHQVKTSYIGLGAPPSPTEQGFAPDGRHFVDSYSTPVDPEVTVLRRADGRVIAELAKVQASQVISRCYHAPERVVLPAPEGREALHGTLHFPCDFDPTRHYPVIDAIYNGSQVVETPRRYSETLFGSAQHLAELGFVVLVLDARGTPLRSSAFLEFAAEHPDQEASIGDHVHALKLLAKARPYLDLARVGITGVSNGGYASLRAMLAYPDFFKVCVSANGSHDLRKYMGAGGLNIVAISGANVFDAFKSRTNQDLAARLRGDLLLILGGFDMNVPNANTYGVVQSLFEAGKNFDMVVVPRMGHNIAHDPFATRKQWDYFVEHLLHQSPPQDYVMPTLTFGSAPRAE